MLSLVLTFIYSRHVVMHHAFAHGWIVSMPLTTLHIRSLLLVFFLSRSFAPRSFSFAVQSADFEYLITFPNLNIFVAERLKVQF